MPPTETMQKSKFWKYSLLLAGIAIASIGILILSRFYRIDNSEYYPYAYLILLVAAGASFNRIRLNDLRREGKLHGLVLAIAERGFAGALVQRYMQRQRFNRGPLLRLSILAVFIFLLVWVLASNDLLFDHNLYLIEKFDWMAPDHSGEAMPVRQLYVFTHGRGTKERLELMERVTTDLVHEGAKVVVLELPTAVPQPFYDSLVSEIQSTGKVVFAVQNDGFDWQPVSWSTRSFYGPWIAPDTVVKNWGLLTGLFGRLPRFHRSLFYVPDSYVHNHQFESDTVPDVTLEILRKWRDYPASLKPLHAGRVVVFGNYRIPVSSSGVAISPGGFSQPTGFLNIFAGDDWKSGKFFYRWTVHGDERTGTDLHEFQDQIRGTITIVAWSDPVQRGVPGFLPNLYATSLILRDELQGRFPEVRDDLTLPLTILVLIAGVLLAWGIRPLLSIPLLALLGGLVIYGSAWLYWQKLIIVEMIYPVAGLGLAVLLLPLAKISVEAREEEHESPSVDQVAQPAAPQAPGSEERTSLRSQ